MIADEQGKVLKEVSKPLGVQTNNWAEYEAVAFALSELTRRQIPIGADVLCPRPWMRVRL